MVCCWENLLRILPAWMREDVNSLGREDLQELHLRKGQPPQLILKASRQWLRREVRQEDLSFCLNAASQYSPWAAKTIESGYLTACGGHRIGVCGEVVIKEGIVTGIRETSSLCIRVARDFPGIGQEASSLSGSVLILGPPGWGKTTLLRDLIRIRSRRETVGVVDERGELFPDGFDRGLQTDVLTGCSKAEGILRILKTMSPQTIAVDEITEQKDCDAVLNAWGCGVSLLASAHGSDVKQLKNRRIYRALTENHIFDHVLILQKDQSYRAERMDI